MREINFSNLEFKYSKHGKLYMKNESICFDISKSEFFIFRNVDSFIKNCCIFLDVSLCL